MAQWRPPRSTFLSRRHASRRASPCLRQNGTQLHLSPVLGGGSRSRASRLRTRKFTIPMLSGISSFNVLQEHFIAQTRGLLQPSTLDAVEIPQTPCSMVAPAFKNGVCNTDTSPHLLGLPLLCLEKWLRIIPHWSTIRLLHGRRYLSIRMGARLFGQLRTGRCWLASRQPRSSSNKALRLFWVRRILVNGRI